MSDSFRTSDIQLASWLTALGHEATNIEGTPERREFVFQNIPDDAVGAYYTRQLRVAALDLFSAYRRLKARLYH